MHITGSAAGRNEKILSATPHIMHMNLTRMTHIIFKNHSWILYIAPQAINVIIGKKLARIRKNSSQQ